MNPLHWKREHLAALILISIIGSLIGTNIGYAVFELSNSIIENRWPAFLTENREPSFSSRLEKLAPIYNPETDLPDDLVFSPTEGQSKQPGLPDDLVPVTSETDLSLPSRRELPDNFILPAFKWWPWALFGASIAGLSFYVTRLLKA